MKTSLKFFAVLFVIALYATLFYVVTTFVDAANAGLHMNP
jgi:uncharacterized membrane protein